MFILTEATPNPEAMKFIPHVRLTDGAAWSFAREGFDPGASPLAGALFGLDGVRRVFVAAEFVTVTRDGAGPAWDELRYAVISALADHLDSGRLAVTAAAGAVETGDRIEGEIRQALELYVRPGVARDGGDVLFERFDMETGVLWIRMQGACGGCPSARVTLKAGVERIVRQHVPEVARVEEAADGAEAASAQASRGAGARLADWARALTARTATAPGTVFTHSGREVRRA